MRTECLLFCDIRELKISVIPAQAGIQIVILDSHLRVLFLKFVLRKNISAAGAGALN